MSLLDDSRYALRTLRRAPVFCSVAIASLALGIGANTAIFSLVDQLLLRLLPVKNPEELVLLSSKGSNYGDNTGRNSMSYLKYTDFRDRNPVFSGMFARFGLPLSLSVEGKTERVSGELVTGNYFPVLGTGAALGRVLTTSDDLYQGAHPVAVLSYPFWQARFGGDRSVVGRKILVNGYPLTIVGVSQKGFYGIDPSVSPEIRVPMMMKHQLTDPRYYNLNNRRQRFAQVFGRLKPGVSLEQAKAGLQPLYHSVLEMELRDKAFANATDYTRKQYLRGSLDVLPAAKGRSQAREQYQNPLLILMCVVAFVLLIACANLANLLIARAAARQKEMAMRLALGASRYQLVRQLLTESLVLSCAGGLLGLGLASLMNRALIGFIPQGSAPLALSVTPDWRVLLFAGAVSLATGILFGLAPALQSTTRDLAGTLKAQAANVVGGGAVTLRKALVAAQVTLSLLLLIGAGLFLSTLRNLRGTDPGFAIDKLITFKIDPQRNGYSDERSHQLFREVRERLNGLPGVRGAGLAVVALLDGNEWDSSISVEGYPAKPGEDMNPHMNYLQPGFFSAVEIPLVLGRDFTPRDNQGAPKVAVVNEKFAKRFFGGANPVGHRIGMGGNPNTKSDITIVGMVRDTKYEGVREDVPVELYLPNEQVPFTSEMAAYVRTEREPEQTFAAVRQAIHGIDANLPVYDMRTLGEQVDRSLSTERLVASLSAVFGVLATLLAAIGLYGVMAYTVTRRTREIGIRMALGAARGQVLWLILREILTLMAAGVAIGLPASWLLTKLVQSQLYGVEAHDPWTIVAAVTAIALVTALSGYAPGRRATRIHPMEALRWE